jgi:hypothetical protein
LKRRSEIVSHSAFVLARVRPAHRDTKLTEPRAAEWLLIEWPQGEAEPTKYWFPTLPEDITFVCPRISPSNVWSISQSGDGGSSAIIRS